jgi:protein-tyrosine phosphatase
MRMPPPPLANSYWVVRGRLLAGEHPAASSEDTWRRRLQLLTASGVRTFIDLTHEGEMPDYRPLLPANVQVHRLPIPDHSVPEHPARMREIQQVLAQAMAGDDATYVHCRAGYGRTGTVVGCYLREQGHSPEEALAELNRAWQQNARVSVWPTAPETDDQERYILDWKVQP